MTDQDIVDQLRDGPTDIRNDHDHIVKQRAIATQAAAEIERLRREVEEAEALARRFNSGEEYQSLMKLNNELLARALTAESAVAAAWEEAAKIAEGLPTSVSVFLTKREADAATLTKLDIASAIRAAVSKKTAESNHSPSTPNTRTE